MIKEAYVSCEVAKLLREKGFNEFCENAYADEDLHFMRLCSQNSDWEANVYSAPTQQIAARWLREEYGLHVAPYMSEDSDTDADGQTLGSWIEWYYDIYDVCGKEVCHNETEPFQSYEEATEAGLLETLKMI